MYQLLEIIQCMNRTGLSESYSPIAVWLHQDGFKQTSAACNRARGWYGTKGKCKRVKKGEDIEGIARNSAKESIQSRTGKKKPDKTLKTMFKEADKIGNKYQDPKDVAANKAEIKAIAKAPRKPKAVAAKTVVEKKPIAAKTVKKSQDETGSGKPIKNYEEFKTAAAGHLGQIVRDENMAQDGRAGYLPIKRLRDALGSRLSAKDFESHLLSLQSKDLIELQDNSDGKDDTQGGIKTPYGSNRTDIKIDKSFEQQMKKEAEKLDIEDSRKADKVPGRIKNQKQFESEVDAAMSKISRFTGDKSMVAIYRIRRELGDKVTRKEFSDSIQKMSRDNDQEMLEGTADHNSADIVRDGVVNGMGRLRAYMKAKK